MIDGRSFSAEAVRGYLASLTGAELVELVGVGLILEAHASMDRCGAPSTGHGATKCALVAGHDGFHSDGKHSYRWGR